MKSSFDDTDRYELSELGQEFVHYVLHDAVTRVEGDGDAEEMPEWKRKLLELTDGEGDD